MLNDEFEGIEKYKSSISTHRKHLVEFTFTYFMNTASFELNCVLSDQCRYLFIAKFKCIPPAIVCNSQQGTKKKVSTHDHAVSHDNQTHCTMCIIISWISISASFEWILVNLIEWWQSCGILKILIFFSSFHRHRWLDIELSEFLEKLTV